MVDWTFRIVSIALVALLVRAALVYFVGAETTDGSRAGQNECEAFELGDFPSGLLHTRLSGRCEEEICKEPRHAALRLVLGSWQDGLSLLFPKAWRISRRIVDKPIVLPRNARYIRVDSDLLSFYAYFLFMSYQSSTLEWSVGRFTEFREADGILVAKKRPVVAEASLKERYAAMHDELSKLTLSRLRDMVFEDLAETRPVILLRNGGTLRHPIQTPGDLRRGGWVIATAMVDGHDLHKPIVRSTPAPSSFGYKYRGPDKPVVLLPPEINMALWSVIATLINVLQPAFPNSKSLQDAIDVVQHIRSAVDVYIMDWGQRMVFDQLDVFSQPNPVAWDADHMEDRTSGDCNLIVDVFNSNRSLTDIERKRMEPFLLQVSRCAVTGLLMVLEKYVRGHYIREPDILRRYQYVYLELAADKKLK